MASFTRRSVLSSSAAALLLSRSQVRAVTVAGPLRLMGNENPYGPSPSAAAAAAESIPGSWRYVLREERTLVAKIAEREGVTTDNVLLTAGSAEGLRIAALMACGRGGEVVAPAPTFPFLQLYARRLGADIKEVALDHRMANDLDAITAAISPRTKLVYLCNPNNPTGTVVASADLRKLIERVPNDVLTVVDEAYVDLLDDPAASTMVDTIAEQPNVFVTRTFSKVHGLAGLRVGFVIASGELIQRARYLRMSMGNMVSVHAATASYDDIEYQDFSRRKIIEAREVLYDFCRRQQLDYTPSSANFVLVKTGRVNAFRSYLRDRKILVGGSYAGYPDWCRISLGKVEDMHHFADVAKGFFA